jgi:hypothetical protein
MSNLGFEAGWVSFTTRNLTSWTKATLPLDTVSNLLPMYLLFTRSGSFLDTHFIAFQVVPELLGCAVTSEEYHISIYI